jgi:hypothetical protein
METHDSELARRATDLYWDSDASVNDIADQLDLSKGALYGMIEARPADVRCPECGTPMEFPNRTALEKGLVTCPGCDLEEELELVQAAGLDMVDPVPPPPDSAGPAPPDSPSVPVRTLVASTLLGLAAGIAIGQWSGRR